MEYVKNVQATKANPFIDYLKRSTNKKKTKRPNYIINFEKDQKESVSLYD